jgi:hypothetical protein
MVKYSTVDIKSKINQNNFSSLVPDFNALRVKSWKKCYLS